MAACTCVIPDLDLDLETTAVTRALLYYISYDLQLEAEVMALKTLKYSTYQLLGRSFERLNCF